MQAVLARKVQRRVDARRVPGHAADVHQTPGHLALGPVSDGQLADADRGDEVDVQHGIVARVGEGVVTGHGVSVGFRVRGFPEGRPLGLEEAGAGDDNVDGGKGGEGGGPHGCQLRPGGYVGLDEEQAGGGGRRSVRVGLHEGLGFGLELEVGDEDGAALAEEDLDKLKVDSWRLWLVDEVWCFGRRVSECLPEPPPVTTAAFPSTEMPMMELNRKIATQYWV